MMPKVSYSVALVLGLFYLGCSQRRLIRSSDQPKGHKEEISLFPEFQKMNSKLGISLNAFIENLETDPFSPEGKALHKKETVIYGHRIKWIDENNLQIDEEKINLSKVKTSNLIDGSSGDVSFANSWEKIYYFESCGQGIIGVSLKDMPCTGLACNASFILFYDVGTKSTSFFGKYFPYEDYKLYQQPSSGKCFYLSESVSGDPRSTEGAKLTLEAFIRSDSGKFELALDANGKPYQLKIQNWAPYCHVCLPNQACDPCPQVILELNSNFEKFISE